MAARALHEIFGRFVLTEQLDTGTIESCMALRLESSSETPACVVIRRVPLYVTQRKHPENALEQETRWRGLATQQSLPLMVDAGHVGDVPYVAYQYVPGVRLSDVIDRVRQMSMPPLPAPLAATLAVCLCNALGAMDQALPNSMGWAYVHPKRIILPFDGMPVFLGPAYHHAAPRAGLVGVANALWSATTGLPEVLDPAMMPPLERVADVMPRSMAELLRAVLARQFTEEHIGRFASAMESLMLAQEEESSLEAMQAFVRQHFGQARLAWELKREAHTRLVRRLKAKGPRPVPSGENMAQVVELRLRRPANAPEGVESEEEMNASADAFLQGTTTETEIQVVQQLPVHLPTGKDGRPAWRGHMIVARDGKEMVCIHAGTFVWGPDGEMHHLDEYFLDRFPVTNEDYARFCAATGHAPPRHWPDGTVPDTLMRHPVVYVSHQDAVEYCNWAGKRLPTEAEWEKGARGVHGHLWPHGESFDETRVNGEWRKPYAQRGSTPVGAFSPAGDSPFGVADVGHQWEWTGSGHGDPGTFIVRGGAWRNRQQPAQVVNRSWESGRGKDVGFRCAAWRKDLK